MFKRKKGRRPLSKNPSKHRYSFNLDDEENARFLTMVEASGMDVKAHFITSVIFSKPIKVIKIDVGTRDYFMRLTHFYSQFRAIGVNYNQVTKAIKTTFSDRKTLAFLNKLEKATWELVKINKQGMELTKEMEDKYWDGKEIRIDV